MKDHFLTVAILVAAVMFYGLGFTRLGLAAVVAGGVLELWFWVRLFSRSERGDGRST